MGASCKRLFHCNSQHQVPQTVEVLSLKQDNVVHRCLEGIKAGKPPADGHKSMSKPALKVLPDQVESNTDFSLFRESRVQEDVQAHATFTNGSNVCCTSCCTIHIEPSQFWTMFFAVRYLDTTYSKQMRQHF